MDENQQKARISSLPKLAEVLQMPSLPWPSSHKHILLRKRPDRVTAIQALFFDELPDSIKRAVPSRRYEYVLGRLAAFALLSSQGTLVEECWVGIKDGGPSWPSPMVGSITHTHELVAVTVGPRSERLSSVGIDMESLLDVGLDTMEALRLCFNHKEQLLLGGMDCGLVIGFSVKEALFKCLRFEAGRYFDFREAEITGIDMATQQIQIRLLSALSPQLERHKSFLTHYRIIGHHVWTGVLWEC